MKAILISATILGLTLAPQVANTRSTEQQCLALNLFYEANNSSRTDMVAVGHVTLNRVKSNKFPKTICGVIHQKGQFSWISVAKKTPNSKDFFESEKIANQLLNNEIVDNTNGALYFYNYRRIKNPAWSKHMTITLQTNVHRYLKAV